MYIGPRLSEFVGNCRTVEDELLLKELLEDITPSIGCEQFALVSHVDLVGPPREAMIIMNYDERWVERSLLSNYYVDDPVHAASTRTVTAFLWSLIPKMISLTQRQARILEEARPFGLVEGLTVPVHSPGEYRGTCSFGGRRPIELTAALLGTVQLIGMFAFEAARRLQLKHWGIIADEQAVPALSPRQLDCIALVACGKTDKEIGIILGLSQHTVRDYVDDAMRRYDVYKRTELVVRALFDGQICYRTLFRS